MSFQLACLFLSSFIVSDVSLSFPAFPFAVYFCRQALERASSGMLRLYLTHFHAFKDGWRLGTVDGLSQHARYLDSFANVDHLVGQYAEIVFV